jgi:hypothetical protein
MEYKNLVKAVNSKPKIEYKTRGGYVVRMIKVPQPLSQNLGSLLAAAGVPVPKES